MYSFPRGLVLLRKHMSISFPLFLLLPNTYSPCLFQCCYFFLTALSRSNSHTKQFTHLKYTFGGRGSLFAELYNGHFCQFQNILLHQERSCTHYQSLPIFPQIYFLSMDLSNVGLSYDSRGLVHEFTPPRGRAEGDWLAGSAPDWADWPAAVHIIATSRSSRLAFIYIDMCSF